MWEHNSTRFCSIKKTTQTGLGASFSQPVEDDDEADESYNPLDDKEDEAGAQNTIPMDVFQTEMRTAVEQHRNNQEIQGIRVGTSKASIDHQEVMLARLCQRFMPDQSNSGGGGMDFGP
ncbi:hypothetical protein M9H77_36152 [Catharanthus roseus]|uniref:Uncharacterized protein n=1 Tax=Catharanthus roseus TaxID=4058 RepID=A0ACB9ZV86_CATRO|nr:hypothetical protein M9H77_36152 [Catharanthus roseus]